MSGARSGSAVLIDMPLQAVGKQRTGSAPGRRYTPHKTRAFEGAVSDYAALAMRGRQKFMGPVRLDICIEYATPSSWSKKKTREFQGLPHTSRPDADNLHKSIADAFNGIVWHDDCQVAEWSGRKRWSHRDRISVLVEEVGNA